MMLVLALALSPFTVTNSTYDGPVRRPANMRLVWRDEFNGRALDLTRWRYDTAFNKRGWFNNEKQYYSAGPNLLVRNGVMTIEARHEAPRQFPEKAKTCLTSRSMAGPSAW